MNTSQAIKFPLTGEHAERARSEGWGVFDDDTDAQIQFDQEVGIFNCDDGAWNMVIKSAMMGDEFHIGVIAAIKASNEDEYALWVNESRIFRVFTFDTDFQNNREESFKRIGINYVSE